MTQSGTDDPHFRGTERFEVRRQVGTGGFGFVYEAWDRERKERVAIKTLRTATPATILLLKNEFRVVHDMNHPNLARLGELFEHEGLWFFTMELLEGTGFTQYVRPTDPHTGTSAFDTEALPDPTGAFDEARLRSVLGQLVRALSVLHAANKVHRDVKPANVLIEASGRLVLLDFGVVADLGRASAFADTGMTGTAHFMAPEQAAAESIGPATDWYAVGVMLFRSLTGRLPFAGSAVRVLEDKLLREAPAPGSLVPGLPGDLERLCTDLLRSDPAARPTGPEILERLDGPAARTEIALATAAQTFVGRGSDQDVLASALRSVRGGRPATVIIHGESGVGKSFLVRQFMRVACEEDPNLVWFVGRCYERESVPFKAFDGIVDQMSEYLANLDGPELARIAPLNAPLLVATFPVLSRLIRETPDASDDGGGDTEIVNPRERRVRVFRALRDLISNLCRQLLVGIVIDDLQWADADSVALISEVFEPTHSPPVLLVGTTRLSPTALVEKFGGVMAKHGSLIHVPLGRLADDDSRSLAETLLGPRLDRNSIHDILPDIVRESGGHPLFIGDLVEQYILSATDSVALRLEDALGLRIEAQSESAKRLLEVLAIAEVALPENVVRTAAQIDPSEFHTLIARLSGLHLIQAGGTGRNHVVDVFHERVRTAVAARIAPADRPAIHLRIVAALEKEDVVDDEVFARHLRGGGEGERANSLVEKAAVAAAASLAFERAARLFAEAADHQEDRAAVRSLRRKQAEALRNGGRLAECAEILVSLAADTDPLDALDLKRTAAELFVCSGRHEKGTALLRETLRRVGERFPEGRFALIFWLLVTRALIAVRGLKFKPKPRPKALTEPHARIDTLWSAGTSFSMTDNARGAYFLTRNLIRALDEGDESTLAHSVLMEICFVSSEGRKTVNRVAVLFDLVDKLSGTDRRPFTQAAMFVTKGWSKYMVGDWAGAIADFTQGEALLRDRVVGYRFQLAAVRALLYRALGNTGRFQDLRDRLPSVFRDAVHLNDQLLLANIRSNPFAWLGFADDAPDRVAGDLDESAKTLPERRFLLQHLYLQVGRCNLDLYRGDAEGAYRRMAGSWRAVQRSLLLRIQVVRVLEFELKARVAVAWAQVNPQERPRLLSEARAHAKTLSREGLPVGEGHSALLLALIASSEPDPSCAVAHFERAIAILDSLDMKLYVAAARDRLGRLTGGVRGDALVAQARAWAEGESVVNPPKLFQLIAPFPKTLLGGTPTGRIALPRPNRTRTL